MTSVVVERKIQAAIDTMLFTFCRQDEQDFSQWSAGAHVDVEIAAGLTRQYSLCGSTEDVSRLTIAVQRDAKSRGGSVAMCDAVNLGDTLQISAPRNHFELDGDEAPILLLAGGIGITPIYAMAAELSRAGRGFELHYFVRSRERAVFLDEMTSGNFAASFSLHLTRDRATTLTDVEELLDNRPAEAGLYFCGPDGFMSMVSDVAARKSWPAERLHKEFFTPPADALAQQGESRPFLLRLATSGRELPVPADKTALEVLRAAGVPVPSSCEQGTCGTCVVKVLDGVPDNRDHFLSEYNKKSGKRVALCVSRALSETLTIEL
ncbi:Phthalate dioxygenase reductase (plasmid) [Sphingobium sp. AntQ-1]|uniref:PDR/VanB family oxidoreductase n=1 Tax=Sphingobium sp. AntQ-1 TaxID=2930091 RepID=UPI00234E8D37|nr:PDR/VanB family oxidoreductase [Sphingobium sp. AntQ-1]WCP16017.1 Phthalate dioxygenase reductase [Sphingobium sp. AntQ-1]